MHLSITYIEFDLNLDVAISVTWTLQLSQMDPSDIPVKPLIDNYKTQINI